MHSQYTWFHNTNSSSSNAPANTATEIKSILPSWGAPGGFFGTFGPLYKSVSQKWELDMDLIDLDLGRWYYVGTKLTFRPSLGLRAALIKQDVDMQYTSTTNTLKIDSETKSWGLGPKVALDANWNIGCGFRVYGNGEADLLYTRYTTLSSHLTNTDHAAFASNVYDTQDNVGTVRSHIELETGLGWGTYLNCNRWYLDFSAGYDFQVFFDQNMFRFFADTNMQGKSLNPNGNLYLQGLTMKARLDF